MAYESLRGALFKNTDKAKPTDRDYGGEVNIEGREFWISGWAHTSKKGAKYLSLSLKPKHDDKSKPTADEMSDEMPF
jgi:hypothetical protein